PRFERVRARLPHVVAHAHLYGERPHGAPEIVPLAADLLHVEPDHDRCSVVWRGSFTLPSELAAEGIVIVGAVQEGDAAITWPRDLAHLEALASPSVSGLDGARPVDLQATAPRGDHVAQPALGVGYRLDGARLELASPPQIGDTIQPPAAAGEIVVPALGAPPVPRFDGTEMIVEDDDLIVESDFGKTDP